MSFAVASLRRVTEYFLSSMFWRRGVVTAKIEELRRCLVILALRDGISRSFL